MWSHQCKEKREREAHSDILEKEWNFSDRLDVAGPLTTSPFNATIPLRHDVALTLIGLSGLKGVLTGLYRDYSWRLCYLVNGFIESSLML